MLRKIYQCQVCGSLVEVLSRGAGGFSCCGAPLTCCGGSLLDVQRQQPTPPIDLIEVRANGKSCWHFQPEEAPLASARQTGAGRKNRGGLGLS